MSIGEKRHRITIEEIDTGKDTQGNMGGHDPEWKLFKKVWAAIKPATGKEFWEAHKDNSDVEGIIEIRYLEDLKSNMRIKFGTTIYKILSFKNIDEKNKEIHIYYKEMV